MAIQISSLTLFPYLRKLKVAAQSLQEKIVNEWINKYDAKVSFSFFFLEDYKSHVTLI